MIDDSVTQLASVAGSSASTLNRSSHPPGYDALALITFGTTGLKLKLLIQ
jgi:hypothetical protein